MVKFGSPIELQLAPLWDPFRDPERGSLFRARNASQTLLIYIMLSAIFAPSKKGLNSPFEKDPIWLGGEGGANVSEKGVPNNRKHYN